MPGTTQTCQERFASIQKRGVFESDVLKIFAKFELPVNPRAARKAAFTEKPLYPGRN
jgi:hypothetical protein